MRIGFLVAAAVLGALVASSTPAFAFKASNPPYCTNQVTCANGRPSVTPNNGQTQHPEVVVMFWQDGDNVPVGRGDQWNTGNPLSNDPTRSSLIGSSVSPMNTAYFASLQQYGIGKNFPGFVGRPRLAPFAPIVTGRPKNSGSGTTTSSFFLSDISNVIVQAIAAGAVPPPSGADDVVYVVFLPQASPGTRSTLCNGAGGCNYSGDNGCTVGTRRISCAYVVAGDASTATSRFSREVTDAIAGYQDATVDNCTYNHGLGTPSQLSDVCQCFTENQNTFAVGSYWSDEDGACVTPESWGKLYENQNTGNSGVTPGGGFDIRQAYGGGGGGDGGNLPGHLRHRPRLCSRARAVRREDRLLPGHQAQAGQHVRGPRIGPGHHLFRRPHRGRRRRADTVRSPAAAQRRARRRLQRVRARGSEPR